MGREHPAHMPVPAQVLHVSNIISHALLILIYYTKPTYVTELALERQGHDMACMMSASVALQVR